MIELDDKLIKKFHQQKDGVYAQDEEQRLCLAAQAYSICENSIAVFSNLRTDSGKSSKMIADRLEISKHTVDRHRQNIIAKLRVNNTTEACHKAKRLGLID